MCWHLLHYIINFWSHLSKNTTTQVLILKLLPWMIFTLISKLMTANQIFIFVRQWQPCPDLVQHCIGVELATTGLAYYHPLVYCSLPQNMSVLNMQSIHHATLKPMTMVLQWKGKMPDKDIDDLVLHITFDPTIIGQHDCWLNQTI